MLKAKKSLQRLVVLYWCFLGSGDPSVFTRSVADVWRFTSPRRGRNTAPSCWDNSFQGVLKLISRCTIPFIAKSNIIMVQWLLQNMRQNRKHRFDLVIWFYKVDDIIFYEEIEYFILCSGHKLMYFHTIIILDTIYINKSTTHIIRWYEGSELPY